MTPSPEHKKSKYDKNYYEENKDKIKKRQDTYRKTEEFKRSLELAFVNALVATNRYKATKQGILFDLNPGQIIIPVRCPYLGVVLTTIRGKGFQPTNASIDRIDPTKGYTHDNIQIISRKANMMKQNASMHELRTFARNILRMHP